MNSFFIKIPNLIQQIYKNLVWSFNTNEKTIYLTFDDGPTPEITEWTLEQLNKFNAKATFFCIGKNVKNHPKIFNKIIKNKHSVGNHTNNHLNGWKNNTTTYLENIDFTETVFKKQLANNSQQLTTTLFRPPYGKIKRKQAKKLINKGYKIIMWTVLSADYDQKITKEKCLENVIKNTENGNIIVFHDSLKASKNMQYALPKVLKHYSEKGYVFKSIQ